MTLKLDMQSLLQAMTGETDSAAGFNKFANELGAAIEKYVKTGVVTVVAGIPVSTAGNASAQTGTTGTGTIS